MPGKRAAGKTARNIAIPDAVYDAAKARAAAAGTTVSAVVNAALARYAAGGDDPAPAPSGAHVRTVLERGTGEHAGQVVLVRRVYDRPWTRRAAAVRAEQVLASWSRNPADPQAEALFFLTLGSDQG